MAMMHGVQEADIHSVHQQEMRLALLCAMSREDMVYDSYL